jgi:hypothetical protein
MVNLAGANEHVPDIERRIQVVKKRCRDTRYSIPFHRIPNLMTIHIVLNVVKLLFFFQLKGGLYDTLSPKTIMYGETLDYRKHLSLQIGQHFQVHQEVNPLNIQIARTKGAIYLGPSGNLQGGFKFMALNTVTNIVRRIWDVISMPDLVITRVNALGSEYPQQMTFTDRHGRLIRDIEIPGADANEDPLPGVVPVIEDDIKIPGVDVEGPEDQDEVLATQVEIDDLNIPLEDPTPIEVAPTQAAQAPETPATFAPLAQEPGLRRSTRVSYQAKHGYTPSMTGSKYSYAVTQMESQGALNPDAHMFLQEDFYQAEPNVVAAIMTQLSLNAGLKEWGEKSFTAAQSEMKQLHFQNKFNPKHWRELSQFQ